MRHSCAGRHSPYFHLFLLFSSCNFSFKCLYCCTHFSIISLKKKMRMNLFVYVDIKRYVLLLLLPFEWECVTAGAFISNMTNQQLQQQQQQRLLRKQMSYIMSFRLYFDSFVDISNRCATVAVVVVVIIVVTFFGLFTPFISIICSLWSEEKSNNIEESNKWILYRATELRLFFAFDVPMCSCSW